MLSTFQAAQGSIQRTPGVAKSSSSRTSSFLWRFKRTYPRTWCVRYTILGNIYFQHESPSCMMLDSWRHKQEISSGLKPSLCHSFRTRAISIASRQSINQSSGFSHVPERGRFEAFYLSCTTEITMLIAELSASHLLTCVQHLDTRLQPFASIACSTTRIRLCHCSLILAKPLLASITWECTWIYLDGQPEASRAAIADRTRIRGHHNFPFAIILISWDLGFRVHPLCIVNNTFSAKA